MQIFFYTAEALQALERTLSAERLEPYRMLADGDMLGALHLYERNTALSESLYSVLQGLEVTLRNTFHSSLIIGLGRSDWYDGGFLEPDQQNQLIRAKRMLTRENKPLDPGRIVAELSFGFWTGLTGPGYTDLWRDHLVKAFPKRTLQRIGAHNRLDKIRKLRNRVAHHEPILSRPLKRDFHQIIDTIAWMCPVTARWVNSKSSFLERLALPTGEQPGNL